MAFIVSCALSLSMSLCFYYSSSRELNSLFCLLLFYFKDEAIWLTLIITGKERESLWWEEEGDCSLVLVPWLLQPELASMFCAHKVVSSLHSPFITGMLVIPTNCKLLIIVSSGVRLGGETMKPSFNIKDSNHVYWDLQDPQISEQIK